MSSRLLWFGVGCVATHAANYGIKKYDITKYTDKDNIGLNFRRLNRDIFGFKHKEIQPTSTQEFERVVLGYDPELDGDADEHFNEMKKKKEKRLKDEEVICLGQ